MVRYSEVKSRVSVTKKGCHFLVKESHSLSTEAPPEPLSSGHNTLEDSENVLFLQRVLLYSYTVMFCQYNTIHKPSLDIDSCLKALFKYRRSEW